MQSPAMQKLMLESDEDKQKRLHSPIVGWQAKEGAKFGTDDEIADAVGTRPLSYEEAKIFLDGRTDRARDFHANSQARFSALPPNTRVPDHMKADEKGSVDAPKRNRAIAAFMEVKVRFKDLMKKWGLIKETVTERVRREAGIDK